MSLLLKLFFASHALLSTAIAIGREGIRGEGAIHVGPCPDISDKIVSLPNLADYMGKWYEIERLENFEAGQECVFAEYTLENGPQGQYVQVNNTGYENGHYSGGIGMAIQPYPPLAALLVSFTGYPSAKEKKPNYNLISLDTSSYALIYDCVDVLGVGYEYAWILAREKSLPTEIESSLRANLTAIGVDLSKMHITNQSPDYCPQVEKEMVVF
ncbi:apolipoprotein D-like [Convolutriloba macropyga]|uniref:apolipoprotein D-like n=1 Tax=Convolutriloba macropyga TaxID=536237 RepID=UPI003F51C4EC